MGTLIAVEGIDGSGKSVVLDACREFFEKNSLKTLDLRKEESYPPIYTILKYQALLCEEPTKFPLGMRVREMFKHNTSADTLAQAFDMDRADLFTNAIIPMLNENKIVVEERSLLSSLAYQGNQGLSWDALLKLPGNALAITYPPKLVILADVPVEIAMKRLSTREKKDGAIFEKTKFLEKVRAVYLSPRFRQMVGRLGADLIVLDTSKTKAGTGFKTKRLLAQFFKR